MESSIRQKMIDESFYKMANNLPILIHEILIKSASGEYIEAVFEMRKNNIKKIVDAEIEATSNYLKKNKKLWFKACNNCIRYNLWSNIT